MDLDTKKMCILDGFRQPEYSHQATTYRKCTILDHQVSAIWVHILNTLLPLSCQSAVVIMLNWARAGVWRAVFTCIHWIADISNWTAHISNSIADISNSIADISNSIADISKSAYLEISAIELEISSIQLQISPNTPIWRYLQFNWRYLQFNCRYLQINSVNNMWKRRAPFSHLFTELQISAIELEISSI